MNANILLESSIPKKHAAFAGNALIIAGPMPLKNAAGPSSFMSVAATSPKPLYMPSGAV